MAYAERTILTRKLGLAAASRRASRLRQGTRLAPKSIGKKRKSSMKTIPLLQTFEAAAALAEQEHDDVYVYAFVIRAWIGELFLQAVAAYADNKDARDRPMQTGQAW